MKIAIFGVTGSVGSTLLVHLLKGTVLRPGDELILVANEKPDSFSRIMAMQADLLDAFDSGIVHIEVCRSLDEVSAVDIFIMAAGATMSKEIHSRSDLAWQNSPIFQNIASRLSRRCPDAFVLIISNPVELCVSIFCRYFPRLRVIGMGAQQDSLRFARAVASALNLPRTAVRASVLGEHGEGMVPLWSSVYILDPESQSVELLSALRETHSGEDFRNSLSGIQSQLDLMMGSGQTEQAYRFVETVSPMIRVLLQPALTVRTIHSTPNATANATLDCIAAIRSGDDRRVHGQVLLEGEFYGLHGVIGIPVALKQTQWRIGVFEPLSETEIERLAEVNETIKDQYAPVLSSLDPEW